MFFGHTLFSAGLGLCAGRCNAHDCFCPSFTMPRGGREVWLGCGVLPCCSVFLWVHSERSLCVSSVCCRRHVVAVLLSSRRRLVVVVAVLVAIFRCCCHGGCRLVVMPWSSCWYRVVGHLGRRAAPLYVTAHKTSPTAHTVNQGVESRFLEHVETKIKVSRPTVVGLCTIRSERDSWEVHSCLIVGGEIL